MALSSTGIQVLVLYLCYRCIPNNNCFPVGSKNKNLPILLNPSPLLPVEMQAVAGRPLLPHVDVLPHGAVPAAGTHSRQQSRHKPHSWIWGCETGGDASRWAKYSQPRTNRLNGRLELPACRGGSSIFMLYLAAPPGFSAPASCSIWNQQRCF